MSIIPDNRMKFDAVGLTPYLSLFDGTGLRVAIVDEPVKKIPVYGEYYHDPFGLDKVAHYNSHGSILYDIVNQIFPRADKYILPSDISWNGQKTTGGYIEKTLPFVRDNKIHIVISSFGGQNHPDLNAAIKDTHGDTCWFASAGNTGSSKDDTLSDFSHTNVFISAASLWRYASGDIARAGYSSVGKDLDFSSIGMLAYHNQLDYRDDNCLIEDGSSFANPLLACQAGEMVLLSLQKTGKVLAQPQMYKLLMDICVDMDSPGFDIKTGYGRPVLPDPTKINVQKYVDFGIKLTIGSKVITVNGVSRIIDQEAEIDPVTNRTLIPGRVVNEELGAEVIWRPETREVLIIPSEKMMPEKVNPIVEDKSA